MSNNPFDEEIDGFGGGGGTAVGGSSRSDRNWVNYPSNSGSANNNYSAQSQLMSATERTHSSQHRSLALIAQSEEMGIATNQDLAEQGEKLGRAERRLDEMGELQKDSQRQLNTLSSIFGGVKNWFARKPSTTPAATSRDLANDTEAAPPRIIPAPAQATNNNLRSPASQSSEFDENLTAMSDGMSRLNQLASSMNAELKQQNQSLDRIQPKMERVSDTMQGQQRQMDKLLGTKAKK